MSKIWPFVIHSSIKRFLTDGVLQEAYEAITTISQKSTEDEQTFADRLMTAVRCCCGIFDDREVVRCYARGLLPQIRERVLEGIRRLPMHDQSDLTAVLPLASSEGTHIERVVHQLNDQFERHLRAPRQVSKTFPVVTITNPLMMILR